MSDLDKLTTAKEAVAEALSVERIAAALAFERNNDLVTIHDRDLAAALRAALSPEQPDSEGATE